MSEALPPLGNAMSLLLLPDKAHFTVMDYLSARDVTSLITMTSERSTKDLRAALGHCLADRLRRADEIARPRVGFSITYAVRKLPTLARKLALLDKSERRDWYIMPGDDVSEQLRALFRGRTMKDGDHIVFAPGTYRLDDTTILYHHDRWHDQLFRNITLRGTGGDPTKVILCAEEGCCLDNLFFVCRDPECYRGPEHPVIQFSGLTFRNDHRTRGRNAIVYALGDVEVIMKDCSVLCPRVRPTSSCPCGQEHAPRVCGRCKTQHYCSRECQVADWPVHRKACSTGTPVSGPQNMLGKFRQPLFAGTFRDYLPPH